MELIELIKESLGNQAFSNVASRMSDVDALIKNYEKELAKAEGEKEAASASNDFLAFEASSDAEVQILGKLVKAYGMKSRLLKEKMTAATYEKGNASEHGNGVFANQEVKMIEFTAIPTGQVIKVVGSNVELTFSKADNYGQIIASNAKAVKPGDFIVWEKFQKGDDSQVKISRNVNGDVKSLGSFSVKNVKEIIRNVK